MQIAWEGLSIWIAFNTLCWTLLRKKRCKCKRGEIPLPWCAGRWKEGTIKIIVNKKRSKRGVVKRCWKTRQEGGSYQRLSPNAQWHTTVPSACVPALCPISSVLTADGKIARSVKVKSGTKSMTERKDKDTCTYSTHDLIFLTPADRFPFSSGTRLCSQFSWAQYSPHQPHTL